VGWEVGKLEGAEGGGGRSGEGGEVVGRRESGGVEGGWGGWAKGEGGYVE